MKGRKKYLSTREVAEALGISESGMRYYMMRYPEIRKIAVEEKKLKRSYLRWPPDAPEKIRRIIEAK